MSMLIGIVGKHSSGKSTFFKAATMIDVPISARPFTTIKPNRGFGFVRVECVDKELGVKCNPRLGMCVSGIRYVPVELLDVAGLVPGASEGKGLGNQFLNDLNQADVLIHIVDVSGTTDETGNTTSGHDPAKDVRFLENEIDMWYLSIIKRNWEKLARKAESAKEDMEELLEKQLSAFRVTRPMVAETMEKIKLKSKPPTKWTDEELKAVARSLREKTKPILIAANKIDLLQAKENFERLKKEFPNYMFVPCSGDFEIALREAAKKGLISYNPGEKDFKIPDEKKLSPQQLKALDHIRSNVLEKFGSTGVQQTLDSAVFDFLHYLAIFPGGIHKMGDKEGRILPDVFFLPPDSTALNFANKIHSDLGKGMLFGYDVRTKKKIGKDHELKNRDVIEIVSAAK